MGGNGGGRTLLGASTNSRENDDDAFDFRDEADSSYLKAIDNGSYADLHAEKQQQQQQYQRDYDPYTEKPQASFMAPTDNRAGMGSGAARKLWAARQASAAANTGGYAVAAAASTPTLDYHHTAEAPGSNKNRATGEAYPLVALQPNKHVDAGRSPSPANAYGYADLVPKAVHEVPTDYQWSADSRGQRLEQQSDWLRSRMKAK